MIIPAVELYNALKALGKQPKTLEIEYVTTLTDTLTGKKKKSKEVKKHALVDVILDTRCRTVDIDKLKAFSRLMKTTELTIDMDRVSIEITYPRGTFCLVHTEAKASATLDLNSLLNFEE